MRFTNMQVREKTDSAVQAWFDAYIAERKRKRWWRKVALLGWVLLLGVAWLMTRRG